jgi:sigma-B regulation protein RsbU (phosphoserine phosphatase)
MSSGGLPLRLVRDDTPPRQSPIAQPLSLDQQIESLQKEISALTDEVGALRRRDETLHYYLTKVDDEMRLAARLQRDFLPKSLPQVGPISFHTVFRPAGYVSGDLYDVMRLDETNVGFYVADAVGHGMPAALLTMFLKMALVTKEITPGGYRLLAPGETMARLNEALVSQQLAHATFATALYGVVDAANLQIHLSRGGHPNPALIGADGNIRDVSVEGSLLGIFPGEAYETRTVQLQPGDRLLVFTDGVEVAFSNNQSVDTMRWRQEVYERRLLPTDELLAGLVEQMDKEIGSLQPKDDLTMILIEAKKL